MTLFARKPIPAIGLAPLSSMFFVGKNDHRFFDDFRSELHDSDGLLMHTGAGEWIWRPLSNPVAPASVGVPRPRSAGLRAFAARPQLQRLPGSRTRLRAEAKLLDRAARRLGRGQGRTSGAADRRRDQRQHRGGLGAEGRARPGKAADLRLPDHLADDGPDAQPRRTHGRDLPVAPRVRSAPPNRRRRARPGS